jgi:hypothetical protein
LQGSRGQFFQKGVAPPTYSRSDRCRSFEASSQKFAEKTRFQKVLVKSAPWPPMAKNKKFKILSCTFFKKFRIIHVYFLTKEMNDDNETMLDIIGNINVFNGHVCKKAGRPAGNF